MRKIYSILLLSTVLSSCNYVNIEDIQGNWEPEYSIDKWNDFSQLQIKGSKFNVIDKYGVFHTGDLSIKNNTLNFNTDSDFEFNLKCNRLVADTIVFKRHESLVKTTDSIKVEDQFRLLNIKTDKTFKFSTKSRGTNNKLVKTNSSIISLIVNQKSIDFDELPSSHYIHNNPFILFISEDITLADLQKTYVSFYTNGISKVKLLVGTNYLNEYYYIGDRIHIWTEELSKYPDLSINIPPQPDFLYSVENFEKHRGKVYSLSNLDEIDEILNKIEDHKFIALLVKDLSIQKYITLISRLNNLDKSLSNKVLIFIH